MGDWNYFFEVDPSSPDPQSPPHNVGTQEGVDAATGADYDWPGFFDVDPLSAQPPLSPTVFGKLLVSQVDAPSALGLLGGEPALGNPLGDGYILSSTILGVRSWIPVGSSVLPDQTGHAGEFLTTDGSNPSWASVNSAVWGNITGTLADQLDLQSALDAKQDDFTVQSANRIFAGPTSGGAATPTFRALVAGDIPDLSATYQSHSTNLDGWSAKTPYSGDLVIASSKTPTLNDSFTLTGTASINLGSTNGTLGSAAFTASSAYEVPLSFTSPLSRSTNTISIPAATSSVNGYLTSTDWNTFNNKQPAGSYGDFSSNTSTSVDGEVVLFSGTAGKTGKRATGSGLATLTSGVLGTTANNSSNWDTAYTERHQWDGGSTNLNASTGRTSLGLVIGTNVEAWSANLDSWSALATSAKEDALGNPSADGYILSSTTGGTRSWIAPPTGFSGLYTDLDFTSGNITSIPNRSYNDLQNLPTLNSRQTFSDADVVITPGTTELAQTGTITAQRTVELPLASAYEAGTGLVIVDESGTLAGDPLRLVILPVDSSADKINGDTGYVLRTPYGYLFCKSDGATKWTVGEYAAVPRRPYASNMYDQYGVLSVDVSRHLIDSSNKDTMDWDARHMTANDGTTLAVDWSDATKLQFFTGASYITSAGVYTGDGSGLTNIPYSSITGTPVIGTDVEAWSANLDAWSALATSAKQDHSTNLDGWSALATSAKANSGANTDITSLLLNQTGLVVKGGSANALTIKPNETLSAARILNLKVNDADRTIDLSGNLTLSHSITLDTDGTGTRTLNIGAGGTLGSNAFNSTAFSTTTIATDTLWDALGDLVYGTGADTGSKLSGNTTTTRKFLRQTGNGSVSAPPAWDTLVAGDIPDLSGTYQPLDAALTALAAGSDFVQFTGPTTSTKVFALPNASSTLLYDGGALGTPSSGTVTNLTGTGGFSTTGSAASLSISGQTGLLTFTGLTSTSRAKTVRDAADTILELGGSYTPTGTWTSMPLTTPKITTGINDANGNSMLAFTATASAVDGFTFTNAATANPATVTIAATGSDSNINIALTPKGTAGVVLPLGSLATNGFALQFTGDTNTGWYRNTANQWTFATGGNTPILSLFSSAVRVNGAIPILFASGNSTTSGDTGIGRNGAGVVEITNSSAGQWGAVKCGVRDSGTTTVTNGLTIGHQSTGTPAAGLGSGILFNINSSTTADQNAAQIAALWTDATHATRTSDLVFYTVNSAAALAEGLRVTGAGHVKLEGVTSTGATGTGKFVFDTAPTITTLKLAAGTASLAPFNIASGTVATTPVAGDIEYDGVVHYGTAVASERGVVNEEQFISTQGGAYTLTNQTAAQKMFNSPTNGAVTVGGSRTYHFECEFDLSSMSSTSGSFGFAIGGTATFTYIKWWNYGFKNTLATSSATGGTMNVNSTANTALTPSNTNTVGWTHIRGIMRINAGGTVIPQVSLTQAAAAVVGQDSYFRIWPVGTNTVTSIGNWS